ncbi:MAG: PDZ domain-containing protein, partial [Lentisphaeria bacterium]|nr:PDZ domain-containing protein [Lentisphaeria bacterium]
PKEIADDTVIAAVDGVPVAEEDSPMTWEDYCYRLGFEAETVPETLKLNVWDADAKEYKDISVTPEVNAEWATGLRVGDRIFGVNGKGFTAGTDEFQKEYVYGNTGHVTLTVLRDGKVQVLSYQPQKNPAMEGLGFPFFETVNPVQIAQVAAESPAALAGIQSGDQLLSLGGKNILGPMQFLEELKKHSGEAVEIVVARNGRELAPMTLQLPADAEASDETVGISFNVLVTGVLDGSPSAAAGINYGDRFLELVQLDADGKEAVGSLQVRDVQSFRDFVQLSQGNPLRVVYERDGKRMESVMTPTMNAESGKYVLGVIITGALPKSIQHVDPWTQFTEVMGTSMRTLGLLFAPITGRVKSAVTGQAREVSKTQIGVQHMSGPLGIIYALWYRLRAEGYRGGFSFIILITFSLALMNLLPLPVLDGGHIVFAAIEGITRRRIPVAFFKYIYNTFAILLIALMLYITLFDGRRILKRSGLMDSKKAAPVAQEVQNPETDK